MTPLGLHSGAENLVYIMAARYSLQRTRTHLLLTMQVLVSVELGPLEILERVETRTCPHKTTSSPSCHTLHPKLVLKTTISGCEHRRTSRSRLFFLR